MKTKSILSVVLIVLFMSACKNTENTDAKKDDVAKVAVKERFSVEMTVQAQKQDDFTVFYTEDGTNSFDGVKAVWSGVKGGNVEEHLLFDLPEEVIPTNIRVDFGIKKEREDVTLKNMKIEFYGKSLEIKGSDFFTYFLKNEPVMPGVVDAQAGTVTFKRNHESKEGTYYYPSPKLLEEIAKMTKQ